MPIVQVYQHPRYHGQYYSLDEKRFYLEDLKREAFDNLSKKYLAKRYVEVKEEIAKIEPRSILDIVSIMNIFRKDVFKTMGHNLSYTNFISAWRNRMFSDDFVIKDYFTEIELWHSSFGDEKNALSAQITVPIYDMGFLWPLFGQGTLDTELFGDNTLITFIPPGPGGSECGELQIHTDIPEIVDWTKDIIDYLNTYRELNGQKTSNVFSLMDILNVYGRKIRIY